MLRFVRLLAAVGVRALIAVLGIEVVVAGAVNLSGRVNRGPAPTAKMPEETSPAVVAVRDGGCRELESIVAVRAFFVQRGLAGFSARRGDFCRRSKCSPQSPVRHVDR